MQMAYRCDYQLLPEKCASTSPPKSKPKVQENRRPDSRKRRRSSQAREVMKREKGLTTFSWGSPVKFNFQVLLIAKR